MLGSGCVTNGKAVAYNTILCSMELFSFRRWTLDRPKQKAVVFMLNQKNMQHMHGIIPKFFDCWADPVAHLLLLKSSMDAAI